MIDAAVTAAVESFFVGVGAEPIDRLLATGRMRTARAGELLLGADEQDAPAILLEGMARTIVSLPDGRNASIHYLRPVGIYGLPTLFFAVPLSVRAVTRSKVMALDAPTLVRAAKDYPKLGWFVSRQLAGAVLRVPAIIEEFGFKTVTQRIASHLMALSEPDGVAGGRTAPVTQTMLAEFAGTAREVVWRSLRKMASDGIVSYRRGSIHICDVAALGRVAAGA